MVRLQREPIDTQLLIEGVRTDASGAVALFVGTVRNHNRGRRVIKLAYTAYDEMAVKELERVRAQALGRFEVNAIAIVHRLGDLNMGDASVAVAVAAAHREDAFDACRFVIDTLKKTVPIWKKETFEGGEEWIEGGG